MLLKKLKNMEIGFETGQENFKEKRPTLVMLHGAGGCSRIWENQVRTLNNFMNTLALDLPGHGETAGQSTSRIAEYSRWLGRVLGMLFDEPIVLMGHSLGGAIVQDVALLYPDLLRGLILVGTGPILRVSPGFLQGFSNKFEETIDMVMHYGYAPGADASWIRESAALMKEAGAEVVTNDFVACDGFDRRKDLGKIDLPCLVVCGAEDKLTPPALSETLAKSIKKSTLEILQSAGHHVMIERQEEFNRCVKNFVLKLQN